MRASLFSSYTEVAKEHFKKAVDMEPELDAMREKKSNLGYDDYELGLKIVEIDHEIEKHSLITIVFSALALEAFIYDYGARKTSDNFIQKYIDKLDLVSKWVVIPKLITGKDFPRNGNSFELLKKLVKIRNLIVHYKSFDVPWENAGVIAEKWDGLMLKGAKEAIAALESVANDIEEIDPDSSARFYLGLNK